jgi:DNA-binding beta-propeller fold protein YncE
MARAATVLALGSGLLLLAPLRAQNCTPFADVAASDAFCPAIQQLHAMGLTAGINPGVAFGPLAPVTRQVLAAILARADRPAGASPGSRRAALGRFWTTRGGQYAQGYGLTTVGDGPVAVKSDGVDVWVANQNAGSVTRVRASDGAVVGTWTGIPLARSVLVAMGRVFVLSGGSPSQLWEIDPRDGFFAFHVPVATLGSFAAGMTFDGGRIWVANSGGTLSIATPGSPWTVASVPGFSQPDAMLFDGKHVWVTDVGAGTLLELDAAGGVLETVNVGSAPARPAFDGTNIWVPRNVSPGHLVIVRAATATILADLTDNVAGNPIAAAFDGERILLTHYYLGAVTLWNAADRAFLGQYTVGSGVSSGPFAACSDGIDFWVALGTDDKLARF